MNEEIRNLIAGKPEKIQDMFVKVENMVMECGDEKIEEKIWAKMPSYYWGECFVRIIPFNDHLNIEASEIEKNALLFQNYKITPKGMLQIFVNQDLPEKELKSVFYKTLTAK